MARPSSFDRQDALANARNLFWRKGFNATSLKDIEGALSLRPGSIYAAFGSKKDLFSEALKYYANEAAEDFHSHLDNARTPIAGLVSYVRSITMPGEKDVPSNACMVFKTALELANDESDLKQLARSQLAGMATLFATAFTRARETGEISSDIDPHRAAVKLQSSIAGLRGMIESGLSAKDARNLSHDIVAELEQMRL